MRSARQLHNKVKQNHVTPKVYFNRFSKKKKVIVAYRDSQNSFEAAVFLLIYIWILSLPFEADTTAKYTDLSVNMHAYVYQGSLLMRYS